MTWLVGSSSKLAPSSSVTIRTTVWGCCTKSCVPLSRSEKDSTGLSLSTPPPTEWWSAIWAPPWTNCTGGKPDSSVEKWYTSCSGSSSPSCWQSSSNSSGSSRASCWQFSSSFCKQLSFCSSTTLCWPVSPWRRAFLVSLRNAHFSRWLGNWWIFRCRVKGVFLGNSRKQSLQNQGRALSPDMCFIVICTARWFFFSDVYGHREHA